MLSRTNRLSRGAPLGLMGYTGSGINRRRAHVHLEVNLLLNRYFQGCYDDYFPSDENRQGLFNGLNMSGVEVATLYVGLAEDSLFTVRHLVEQTPGFFRGNRAGTGDVGHPLALPVAFAAAAGLAARIWSAD